MIILALEDIYDKVKTEFAELYPNVVFNFGPKQVQRHITTSFHVIDFVPGNEKGDIGNLVMPMEVGGSPRHLYDIIENFCVYCRGFDNTEPENQMKQYKQTMLLAQAYIACARRQASGLIKFNNWRWNRNVGSERLLGGQIIIDCTLRSPIPDLSTLTTPLFVGADINQAIDNTSISYSVPQQFPNP